MNKETYEFANQQLTLEDQELGLSFQESFAPALLPSSPKGGETLPDGSVVIKSDCNGWMLLKDEKREGETVQLYPDEELRSRSYYLQGRLHGPSRSFTPEGQLLAETWFLHGERVGKSRFYYPSGKIYSICRFASGVLDGKQEYFYESGQPHTLVQYQKGTMVGTAILYQPDGTIKKEVPIS